MWHSRLGYIFKRFFFLSEAFWLDVTTSKDECTWTRLTSVVFTRKRPFTEEWKLLPNLVTNALFVKVFKETLVLTKSSLNLTSSKCLSFWWITHLLLLGGRVFLQTVRIPISTNCAHLLRLFVRGRLHKRVSQEKTKRRWCHFTKWFQIEIEIKNTTHTTRSASYLDIHL